MLNNRMYKYLVRMSQVYDQLKPTFPSIPRMCTLGGKCFSSAKHSLGILTENSETLVKKSLLLVELTLSYIYIKLEQTHVKHKIL